MFLFFSSLLQRRKGEKNIPSLFESPFRFRSFPLPESPKNSFHFQIHFSNSNLSLLLSLCAKSMEAIEELVELADSMRQASFVLADEDVDEKSSSSSSSKRPTTFLNVVALGNVVSSSIRSCIRYMCFYIVSVRCMTVYVGWIHTGYWIMDADGFSCIVGKILLWFFASVCNCCGFRADWLNFLWIWQGLLLVIEFHVQNYSLCDVKAIELEIWYMLCQTSCVFDPRKCRICCCCFPCLPPLNAFCGKNYKRNHCKKSIDL